MFTQSLRTALLGSGAAFAMMAGPALAGQADGLQAEIDSLRSQVDQLEKERASIETPQAAAPADAVIGGDFPGSFKLPGSDTSVAVHGYVKANFIYDFDENLGDSFADTGITGRHTPQQHQGGNFHFGSRQSRFDIETRTPTDWGQLKTFIEMDFYGSTVNNNSTVSGGGNTSNPLRMRQAYGQLGPVLAGQTFSNFNDLDDEPELLDFNTGQLQSGHKRQTQLRYTLPVANWTLSFAAENPNPRIAGGNGISTSNGFATFVANPVTAGTVPTLGNNANDMPDLTGHIEYKDVWGDVNLAGVVRHFNLNTGGNAGNTTGAAVNCQGSSAAAGAAGVGCLINTTASAFAGGLIVGGKWKIGQVLGGLFAMDSIAATGSWGPGINRYFYEGSTPPFDATDVYTLNAAGTAISGSIKTVTQTGGIIDFQHWWTPNVRTTIAYSVTAWDFGAVPYSAAQIRHMQTGYVNLIWSPVKAVNIGLEFMYGSVDFRHEGATPAYAGGNSGSAKRLMASLQYMF